MRLVQHHAHVPDRRLFGLLDGRRMQRHELGVLLEFVHGRSVRDQHHVWFMCRSVRMRLVHCERHVSERHRRGLDSGWCLHGNELGVPHVGLPAVTRTTV